MQKKNKNYVLSFQSSFKFAASAGAGAQKRLYIIRITQRCGSPTLLYTIPVSRLGSLPRGKILVNNLSTVFANRCDSLCKVSQNRIISFRPLRLNLVGRIGTSRCNAGQQESQTEAPRHDRQLTGGLTFGRRCAAIIAALSGCGCCAMSYTIM